MLYIGMIFFISSGVVLYFKIFSGVNYAKQRYNKLFKIGITDEEMKRIISKELFIIFFIPVLMGGIFGIIYIAIHCVEIYFYTKLIINVFIVWFIYLIIQLIFYNITLKKYFQKITK